MMGEKDARIFNNINHVLTKRRGVQTNSFSLIASTDELAILDALASFANLCLGSLGSLGVSNRE